MSTRKRPDQDFDSEIRAHIEIETDRLIDEGMPPDEARVAARRRFGNVTVVRERFYEAGRLLWLDHLVQDLRCAARNMRRYPVASLVAVLSLAAGIGATTVSLTVRDVIYPQAAAVIPASRAALEDPDRHAGKSNQASRQCGSCFPLSALAGDDRTVDGGVHVARRARDSHRRPYSQRPHSEP